jgi:competence protein ComEA
MVTVKTTTQKVTETASKAKDSVKTAVAKVSSKLAPGTKFNLNTASAEELEKLPGIGKKKAEAIVAGRPFSKVEDVMKIKGIKTGVFNKIKDYVTVN